MKVSREVGRRAGSDSQSIGSLVRTLGRVAIWVALGLLLVRGLGAVLAPPGASAPIPTARTAVADRASAAVAVRFARAYLEDPSRRSLEPFLAEGASVGGGSRPAGSAPLVAQAEVAGGQELGGGRVVLTVACELRDARTLYLAVPISRSRAGEVAVQGAPWMVAAPSVAGVAAERPRPIAGPGAAAIRALVEKFVPAYLEARTRGDLSYLLAPGSAVEPLARSFELLGAPGGASQLGGGEGPRRTVLVRCRLRDPADGAIYPVAYRLVLVKRARWYVESVEGGLA